MYYITYERCYPYDGTEGDFIGFYDNLELAIKHIEDYLYNKGISYIKVTSEDGIFYNFGSSHYGHQDTICINNLTKTNLNDLNVKYLNSWLK